jgi:hypothetical protein
MQDEPSLELVENLSVRTRHIEEQLKKEIQQLREL